MGENATMCVWLNVEGNIDFYFYFTGIILPKHSLADTVCN